MGAEGSGAQRCSTAQLIDARLISPLAGGCTSGEVLHPKAQHRRRIAHQSHRSADATGFCQAFDASESGEAGRSTQVASGHRPCLPSASSPPAHQPQNRLISSCSLLDSISVGEIVDARSGWLALARSLRSIHSSFSNGPKAALNAKQNASVGRRSCCV